MWMVICHPAATVTIAIPSGGLPIRLMAVPPTTHNTENANCAHTSALFPDRSASALADPIGGVCLLPISGVRSISITSYFLAFGEVAGPGCCAGRPVALVLAADPAVG